MNQITHISYLVLILIIVRSKILKFPNYIKLDVDGIEHKILKGADNHLNDKKLRSLSIELNENFEEQSTLLKDYWQKMDSKLNKKARQSNKKSKFSKLTTSCLKSNIK